MQKIQITNLTLTNYRNFTHVSLKLDSDLTLITGQNGSGKTNILESISLLSPGKGIRSSNFEEICRNNEFDWTSSINLNSKLGSALVESSFDLQNKKRQIKYNGSKCSANELVKLASVVWITPQMEGIFLSSASDRRKFLDRMVFNFFPLHASNLNKFDHYLKERMRHLLLNKGNYDNSWLLVLENKIALIAQEVHKARIHTLEYMQLAIDSLQSEFPKAKMLLSKFDEEISEANFIEQYQKRLFDNRNIDAKTARNHYGIQKTDLLVVHTEKNKLANICSTGEQKAMLISIFLAQVSAIIEKTNATPLLLLDELFVHLDELRKNYLAEYVINSPAQCFITSTDEIGIETIAARAQVIKC